MTIGNHRARTVRILWSEQRGLFRGYVTDVVATLVAGTLLVVGGRERTVAPAWAVINANGGPTVWGAVLLGAGALLVVAVFVRRSAVVGVLWLLALVCAVISLSFAISAYHDPVGGASFVGALFAGWAALNLVSRAQAYREEPRWTR